MMNMLAIGFFFPLCWKLKNQSLLNPRAVIVGPGNLRLQARCGMELCDYVILL